MATTLTLAELRSAAQQRADMVGSNFVTTAEWNSYVNQSLFELYDILVQKYGDDYYVSTTPGLITTDGTNDHFSLPTDFYKLVGVDLQLSGTAGSSTGSYLTLRPFTFSERNRFVFPNAQARLVTNLRYRLQGEKLWLTPIPAAGQTLRVWYVPRMVPLSGDSATSDGISGWLEYVIVDAAIKAMQKEESDVSVLFAQKQALIARIEAAAENRDAGSPAVVSDARGSDFGWPGMGWTGGAP